VQAAHEPVAHKNLLPLPLLPVVRLLLPDQPAEIPQSASSGMQPQPPELTSPVDVQTSRPTRVAECDPASAGPFHPGGAALSSRCADETSDSDSQMSEASLSHTAPNSAQQGTNMTADSALPLAATEVAVPDVEVPEVAPATSIEQPASLALSTALSQRKALLPPKTNLTPRNGRSSAVGVADTFAAPNDSEARDSLPEVAAYSEMSVTQVQERQGMTYSAEKGTVPTMATNAQSCPEPSREDLIEDGVRDAPAAQMPPTTAASNTPAVASVPMSAVSEMPAVGDVPAAEDGAQAASLKKADGLPLEAPTRASRRIQHRMCALPHVRVAYCIYSTL
jgi:hypothetical protein